MTLETYGHIIEELEETPRVSAEAVIGQARREAVNFSSTKTADASDESQENPANIEEPTGRLELPTPSLRVWCRPYHQMRADVETTATKGRVGPSCAPRWRLRSGCDGGLVCKPFAVAFPAPRGT